MWMNPVCYWQQKVSWHAVCFFFLLVAAIPTTGKEIAVITEAKQGARCPAKASDPGKKDFMFLQACYFPSGTRQALARASSPTEEAQSTTPSPRDAIHAQSLISSDTPDGNAAPLPGPPVHSLGLIPAEPVSPPRADKIVEQLLLERRSRTSSMHPGEKSFVLLANPPSADISDGLPPVGDQGAQNSCASWACGYYMKSYQEGREHAWDLGLKAHQFSPAFLYNRLQYYDEGSSIQDNLTLMLQGGCASLATAPYSWSDSDTWPGSAAYREALPYRAQSFTYLGHGETPELFEAVKSLIVEGQVVVCGFPVFRPSFSQQGRFDKLNSSDYFYALPAVSDQILAGYHTVVLVGYDDTLFEGDGGFKGVNSWGPSWGQNGYAFLSRQFLLSYAFDFYTMTDRIGYQPKVMTHVHFSHTWWGGSYWIPPHDNVSLWFGMGNPASPDWCMPLIQNVPRLYLNVDLWSDLTDSLPAVTPEEVGNCWIRIEDHSTMEEDVGTLYRAELATNSFNQLANSTFPFVCPDGTTTLIPFTSAAGHRQLFLDSPTNGGNYNTMCPVRWRQYGAGWNPDETLRIEYAFSPFADWATVSGAEGLDRAAGAFDWNTRDIPSGCAVRLRLLSNRDGGCSVTLSGSFGVSHPTVRHFYANDTVTTGDLLCVAPGSSANDGLTSATPKTSIQAILNTYNLEPGDIIHIDAGLYGAVTVGGDDQGAILEGTNASPASVIQAGTAAEAVRCEVGGVTIRGLTLRGGGQCVRFHLASDCRIQSCRIENATTGVYLYSSHNTRIENSIICNMATEGVYITGMGYSEKSQIINNTFYRCGTEAICNYNSNGATTVLRNNIIWAEGSGKACFFQKSLLGSSDYNDLYATNGAVIAASYPSLSAWSAATGKDTHSISSNPLFASGSDFHLKSAAGRRKDSEWVTDTENSPCIDAGDPSNSVAGEPEPNGSRINLGAYGGTPQASRTFSQRLLTLAWPKGGDIWSGTRDIRWQRTGTEWQYRDTLRIEYSSDAGTTWREIPGASAVLAQAGKFSWDTTTAIPNYGIRFRIRIICNENPQAADESDRNFALRNQAIRYYVNDAITAGDVFCAAPGSSGNDGLTSSTPKASIQSVLDAYNLEPGDIVLIDAGLYGAVTVGGDDQGAILEGTNASPASVIQAGAAAEAVRCAVGGVTIRGLTLRGGTDCVRFQLASDCRIQSCRIENATTGVYLYSSHNTRIENSIICNMATEGVYITGMGYSEKSQIINNTFYRCGTEAICNYNSNGATTVLRNNIVWADGSGKACIYQKSLLGSSDYNDLYATNGAVIAAGYPSLSAWSAATGKDTHSISSDPLFVSSSDFHLKSAAGRWNPVTNSWEADTSNSLCIDAGDPASSVGSEPEPHGFRINLGAYGGTAQASKTAVSRQLTLLSPNGGETLQLQATIRWSAWGADWSSYDTVNLEYSNDGGITWIPISGAQGIPATQGSFNWPLYNAGAGNKYRVRVSWTTDPSLYDESNGSFSISPLYFVNDSNTTNDIYCVQPGNDTNDGKSPQTPKASIASLLAAYDIQPGNIILVDTGYYRLTQDMVIEEQDGGSSTNHVRLIGSPRPGGTVIDRGVADSSSGVCFLLNAEYIDIEQFTLKGAVTGIRFAGGKNRYGYRITNNRLLRCGIGGLITCDVQIRNNVAEYIECVAGNANGAGDWTIENNTITGGGVRFWGFNYRHVVKNNILWANGAGKHCLVVDDEDVSLDFCDYNNFYATNGAAIAQMSGVTLRILVEWQSTRGYDIHSLVGDPLFADALREDYHLRSRAGRWDPLALEGQGGWVEDIEISPCIDAGYPSSSFSRETHPNGARINLGAFGNTPEASRSPDRWLIFTAAGNRSPMHAWEPLRWTYHGSKWDAKDTVHLDYSNDSGTTWHSIPGAEVVPYSTSGYWWDTRTVADGTHYRFRVVSNVDPQTSCSSILEHAVRNLATIEVVSNLSQASFHISGPDNYDGSGVSWKEPNAKPGTYAITWDSVPGYDTPLPETKSLDSPGAAITFTGNYISLATPTPTPSPSPSVSPSPSPSESPTPSPTASVSPTPSPVEQQNAWLIY